MADEDVTVVAEPVGAVHEIAAWPGCADRLAAALAARLGSAPPPPGRASAWDGGAMAAVGPHRWWLFRAAPPVVDPELGAAQAIGAGLAAWRIDGPAAPALLNRLIAIDLRPASFPEGAVAATGLPRVALTLWRSGPQTWRVFGARSSAAHLNRWLTAAAARAAA